jgi:hypothetical protein
VCTRVFMSVRMYLFMFVCVYMYIYVWVYETGNGFFSSNVYSELNRWFSLGNGVSAIDTRSPFFIKF